MRNKPTCVGFYTVNGWRFVVADNVHTTRAYPSRRAAWEAWERGERLDVWRFNISEMEDEDGRGNT